jgi:hypothetical protein
MNCKDILSIDIEKPEKLFKGNTEECIKKEFRQLSSQWHPDKNLGLNTDNIFAHIKSLYDNAILKIKNGTFGKGKIVTVEDKNGLKTVYEYYNVDNFELGIVYYGEFRIIYRFENEYKDFIIEKIKMLKSLNFASNKMKEDFLKFIPQIEKEIEEKDYFTVVVSKKRDFITLKDLKNIKGKVEIKHIAWILSGLYNNICFYYYNQLMYGGISIENVLINPKNHEVYLIGGWWFSEKIGQKLRMLSSRALDVAPIKIVNEKKAHYSLDLDLIRLIGRELYDDISGIRLRKDKDVAEYFRQWMTESSSLNPFDEYGKWQKEVLVKSFGVRKFSELSVDINQIFKGE